MKAAECRLPLGRKTKGGAWQKAPQEEEEGVTMHKPALWTVLAVGAFLMGGSCGTPQDKPRENNAPPSETAAPSAPAAGNETAAESETAAKREAEEKEGEKATGCEALPWGACADAGCRLVSATRYEADKGCRHAAQPVLCLPAGVGCADAFTYARDLEGNSWQFADGCIPKAWQTFQAGKSDWAAAQGPVCSEEITVEIDVFSGRVNPTFALEASALSPLLAPACERAEAAVASCEAVYPQNTLGYRGVLLYVTKEQKPAAVVVAKGCILFMKGPPPVTCQHRLQTATGHLMSADADFSLEKALIEKAWQQGALEESLRNHIIEAIENR